MSKTFKNERVVSALCLFSGYGQTQRETCKMCKEVRGSSTLTLLPC